MTPTKRKPRVKAWEDGWLTVYWDDKAKNFMVSAPSRPDGRLVMGKIAPWIGDDADNLASELDRRGYDLSTLRFEIKRKAAE